VAKTSNLETRTIFATKYTHYLWQKCELQRPRKRPLLQRGEQGVQLGQGGAVGGFECFDAGNFAVPKGLLCALYLHLNVL
jgi:hypothetical protein